MGKIHGVVLLASLAANYAQAEPLAHAGLKGGVEIVLTDEPCAVPAVTNLPYRTTWAEKGVVSEGCFAIAGESVIAYYDDKTVALTPVGVFMPIKESLKGAI